MQRVFNFLGSASLIGIMMCGSVGATPLQDRIAGLSPDLHYKFDEPSGNIVNYGVLGNNFDLIEYGTPGTRVTAGPTGDGALRITDATNYYESATHLPSYYVGSPAFTLEIVIDISGGNSNFFASFAGLGGNGGGGLFYNGFSSGVQTEDIFAGFRNGGVNYVVGPTTGFLHLVMTNDGTTKISGTTLYINGVEVDTSNVANDQAVALASAPFTLNGLYGAGQRGSGWLLDEVALYPRALSFEEVTGTSDVIQDIVDGAVVPTPGLAVLTGLAVLSLCVRGRTAL